MLRAADAVAAGALRAAGAHLVDVESLDAGATRCGPRRPATTRCWRRDLAALAWRIDDPPDAALLHRHYLVVRGRPVGYAAVRAGGTPATPTAVVVDYLAPPRWVAPLLVAAGRAARSRARWRCR